MSLSLLVCRLLVLVTLLVFMLPACTGSQSSPSPPSESVDEQNSEGTAVTQADPTLEPTLSGEPTPPGELITALELTISTSPALAHVHSSSRQIHIVANAEDLPRLPHERRGPSLIIVTNLLVPPIDQFLEYTGEPEVEIVEAPAIVPVGDSEGVAITLRRKLEGKWLVSRSIFVNHSPGRQYQFTLIAPADQWEEDFVELEKVLNSIRFPKEASINENNLANEEEPYQETLFLTPDKPPAVFTGELIAPGEGKQAYRIVLIDVTAFAKGGELVIDITLGNGVSAGSFDLFPQEANIPTEGSPTDSLVGRYDIPRNGSTQMVHNFDEGAVFLFGATGNWFSPQGSTNHFTVTAHVADE